MEVAQADTNTRTLIDNGPKSQLEQSWDGDSPARTAGAKQTLWQLCILSDSDICKIHGQRAIVGFFLLSE